MTVFAENPAFCLGAGSIKSRVKMSVWQDSEKMGSRLKGQKANRLKNLFTPSTFHPFNLSPLQPLSLLPFLLFFLLTFHLALANTIELNPPQVPFATEGGISHWSNFFTEALDNSDLDVRDSQNRPLKSSSAKASLRQLFVCTVVQLLASDDLPLISQTRKQLAKILAPFSEQFRRVARFFFLAAGFALAAITKIEVLTCLKELFLSFCHFTTLALQRLFLVKDRLPLNIPLRC